jgi:glycosyltransferase involved in cell wall biosynthesis
VRIVYLTNGDPTDVHGWSGLTYYISKSLIDAGNEVVYAHSFRNKVSFLLKIMQKIVPKLTGKFLQPHRYPSFYNQYRGQIATKLKAHGHIDFIFSNSSELIAVAPKSIPKAFWVDASFAGMLGYYPEFSLLHQDTIKQANILEQKAYDNAAAIFFASDWAAKTAMDNYNIVTSKVHVVPFGANMTEEVSQQQIEEIIAAKSYDTCNLLFSGVDWNRKGGPLVLKVAEELNNSGIPCKLFIVGCTPFATGEEPPFVQQIGFLSKKNPDQKKQYESLFKSAHFLIVPSKAECYGLVYCEANAYGLPAIATKTGGIPTIIKNDINGKTFDLTSPANEYVGFIKTYFNNIQAYQQLSFNSYLSYKNNLNWDVAGKKVTEIMANYLTDSKIGSK